MKSAWIGVEVDEPFFLDSSEYLEAQFFAVPGKVPIYLKDLEVNHPEATVSLRIRDTRSGKQLVYAPGLKEYDDETMSELQKADCRFVDGTFFTEDELLVLRPDAVSARTMGHAPVTGPHGSLTRLATLPGRSLYIHMNNTNPMLDSNSRATADVHKAGIEIAFDGMEFFV
jgi:pyrroloquinoline quinone biosynthesis protein B